MATRSFSTDAPHAQEALAIFQEIDANQDGRLSLEELMGGSAPFERSLVYEQSTRSSTPERTAPPRQAPPVSRRAR